MYFINIINIPKICLNLILCPVKGRKLRKGRKKEKEKETALEKTAMRWWGTDACSGEAPREPERGEDTQPSAGDQGGRDVLLQDSQTGRPVLSKHFANRGCLGVVVVGVA